jgi:hypothetical protein
MVLGVDVLKPHLRRPDEPKTELKIVYGPGKGKYDTHAEIAQHIRLLEAIADNLSDRFVWRVPISLEMQACGEANARWIYREKRVVVCYELADEFAELYRQYGRTMAFSLDPQVATAPKPAARRPPCGSRSRSAPSGRCDSRSSRSARYSRSVSLAAHAARPAAVVMHPVAPAMHALAPAAIHAAAAHPLRQVSRAFCSSLREL